jgi:hypothetical protein
MTNKSNNSEAFEQEIQDKYLTHMRQLELKTLLHEALNQHISTIMRN